MKYADYCKIKKLEFGDKFNTANLNRNFVYWFDNQTRVKVLTSYGEVITGRIGVTTGCKPSFMVMSKSNSIDSSDLITLDDKVIAYQNNSKKYIPLSY